MKRLQSAKLLCVITPLSKLITLFVSFIISNEIFYLISRVNRTIVLWYGK